jgi:RNA polymerase primary sigma factor
VLTLRFGLGGDEPKTLEEVGAIYGVTRERIRQIESAALKELAKGNSGKLLRQFL